MDNENRHIINTIVTDIVCDQVSYESVRDIDWQALILRIIQEIEAHFDRIGDKKYLRIQELKIDLRIDASDVDHLEEKISEQILMQLEDIVESSTQEGSVELPGSIFKTQYTSSASGHDIEDNFLFLESGLLPWYMKELKKDCYTGLELPELKRLQEMFGCDQEKIRRFVYQSDVSTVLLLYKQIFTTKAYSKIQEWINEIIELAPKYSEKYDIVYRTTCALHVSLISAWSTSPSEVKDHSIAPEFYRNLEKEIQSYFKEATLAFIRRLTKKEPKTTDKISKNEPIVDFNLHKAIESKEQLQVSNAGIVLLHPFMATFFKKLGLVEEGQFQNTDCQQRAISLLHFLATGELHCAEYDSAIYKMICNYPLEQSIPRELPISPFEIEEAESLLSAVIDHWEALKKTSINGLRVNFFQRKGVLVEESHNHYLLHVEPKTVDVLLDKLPWNLSIAKYNWSPHLLTIKWR